MTIALNPMSTAPKDGTWVILFGMDAGEPRVTAAFWSDSDPPGWYDSEAASRRVTDFGWEPDAWCPLPSLLYAGAT